jgi:hypothetical protein
VAFVTFHDIRVAEAVRTVAALTPSRMAARRLAVSNFLGCNLHLLSLTIFSKSFVFIRDDAPWQAGNPDLGC